MTGPLFAAREPGWNVETQVKTGNLLIARFSLIEAAASR